MKARATGCPRCGCPVLVVTGPMGTTLLVDHQPTPLGNLRLAEDGTTEVVPVAQRSGLLYRSHMATCEARQR